MGIVTRTALDYLWQFQRILPRGRIWHRGWGTVQAQDLLTLMPTWAAVDARGGNLIIDAFPCSTDELLPEWEATLGLPDECTGPLDMLQQRQAAVCAKFAARGGASIDYFLQVAASLGFQIQIETYQPFYADISSAGDYLYDDAWAYTWTVIAQQTEVIWFSAGINSAGDPLASWGSQLLECAFNAIKPAHTTIIFRYALLASVWDEGLSIWDAGRSVWDSGVIVDE
jgi:uncharacterized protein YmfQ (DUF2313 family)